MLRRKLRWVNAARCAVLIGALTLAGCAKNAEGNDGVNADSTSTLPQLSPLVSGEELAILHTTMGDITLRFFPEQAPKAVENFVTHAKDGYYDGVLFHRVMEDFMIQGGDPQGTGMGGESIWGGGFGVEYSPVLWHFRGALAMAHSELPDSNGSQFYIVQNNAMDESITSQFKELLDTQDDVLTQISENENLYVRDVFPAEMLNNYIANGGTPHLDLIFNENGHTVFGQVVEGMDVVDAIAAVAVDSPQTNRPVSDVTIKNVTFETVP